MNWRNVCLYIDEKRRIIHHHLDAQRLHCLRVNLGHGGSIASNFSIYSTTTLSFLPNPFPLKLCNDDFRLGLLVQDCPVCLLVQRHSGEQRGFYVKFLGEDLSPSVHYREVRVINRVKVMGEEWRLAYQPLLPGEVKMRDKVMVLGEVVWRGKDDLPAYLSWRGQRWYIRSLSWLKDEGWPTGLSILVRLRWESMSWSRVKDELWPLRLIMKADLPSSLSRSG